MKKYINSIILALLNPISPIITLIIGWLLTILVTQQNEKLPFFINYMIGHPVIVIIIIVLWLIFTAIYTILMKKIEILEKDVEIKSTLIKEKGNQLEHTSGIILHRSGDFANFNKLLRFNEVLKEFVENNTLVECAQIYNYSIKRFEDKVIIRVLYEASYVYEGIDINNLAQTYYEIDYIDYNKIKDAIKTWKKLATDTIDVFREKDALINYIVTEITVLFKKYYNDLTNLSDVSEIRNKHFTEYRLLTLLLRLARRLSTTTFDKKNILGTDKKDIEEYLLNGKRTGILNSILLEDTFMFKYTRNSHKKNGRAYVSFHAKITNKNYIIVFSLQTHDLDSYTNLEYEITNLKNDFINRLNKK